MKISKKAEYALRAMLAISRSAPGTTFSIQTLSAEEHIPLKFLEQILLILRKGSLLHSRRGAGGGYQLAKASSQISVGEILQLIDGPLDIMPADSTPKASALFHAFSELQEQIQSWLSTTMLSDILQKEQQQGMVNFEI